MPNEETKQAPKAKPDMVKEWVGKLNSQNQQEAYEAYETLLEQVTEATAPGSEKKAQRLANQLANELFTLTPEENAKGKKRPRQLVHPSRARNKVLRLLSYVSGAGQVPALVRALGDLETREMARYALDRNPSSEATAELIKALDQCGPDFRQGVIGSLARRSPADVLAPLQKIAAADVDPQVRMSALTVLADFADDSSDAVLAKAVQEKCPLMKGCAVKARVRLAETLCKAGKKQQAAKIFQDILAGDAPKAQKKAAEVGLKTAS